MLEILFSAAISLAGWFYFSIGIIDAGSASIMTVLMLIWQVLCSIHKTLCEIKYK